MHNQPTQPLEDRVAGTIAKFRMIPEGSSRVGVAVSGGADSVCLVRVLYAMGLRLSVIHVNHQLRGEESDGDEVFVSRLAARMGLPFHVRRVDTGAVSGNLEQAARRIRYEFFRELTETGSVDLVATGHTLSDQAETVLFRVLRGAHSRGLAGIRAVSGCVIRPLIEIKAEEVEAYLREAGDTWREDSSNRDRIYARNRIRHDLLPLLKQDWNPEIERTLANQAVLAADDEAYWAAEIDGIAGGLFEARGNNLIVDASKLIERPVAVQRRLVRWAVERVKGGLEQIEFRHAEGILELANQMEGHGRLQAPGIDVIRSFEWLRFAPIHTGDRLAERNYEVACPVEGRAALPGERGWLRLKVIETNGDCARAGSAGESARVGEAELDLDQVLALGTDLLLRTWKPGDQYSRAYGAGAGVCVKVKQMFQDERIPLWDRADWPMITAGRQIVWVRQFGPAAGVAANRDTRRILRVLEISDDGI